MTMRFALTQGGGRLMRGLGLDKSALVLFKESIVVLSSSWIEVYEAGDKTSTQLLTITSKGKTLAAEL